MATSKKIRIDKDNIDIITTTYNKEFLDSINRNGRVKHDFNLLNDERLVKSINQKVKTLKSYNNTIDYIKNNNEFNYFLTVRGINRFSLKKLFDRIRKQDPNLKFISLASWSVDSPLHYHILLNTNLSKSELNKRLEKLDSNLQQIYSNKVHNYIKKNINFDTIHVLKQFTKELDNEELKSKVVEILDYSKILSYSKNIKHKPIEIKNPSKETLQEIYNNDTYLETIEYKNVDSHVQIDKFNRG